MMRTETPMMHATPPLAGIRVLDLTRILPGPFATMIFADLGAEVVKIEHPRGGDPERSSAPLGENGDAYRFGMLNRGKRSIAIDLKSTQGQEVVLELARSFDVVLEGFRPGVVDELGIGPAALRSVNPGLVYASISGYGQTGPYADLPGHDINYQALAGILRYFGGRDAPRIPWLPIADIGGGAMLAVSGILAALVRRAATGRGDYLDLSMAEGALYWQQTRAQWYLATGNDPTPDGLPVTGAVPGYGIYEGADGEWLSLGCLEPIFWERLCGVLDLPNDVGRQRDSKAFDELDARLRAIIATRSVKEWFAVFRDSGVPAAPCHTIADALDDEHFRSRGRLGGSEPHDRIRSPFVYADSPEVAGSAAPTLGADTDAVLREAGYDEPRISGLRAVGAIR